MMQCNSCKQFFNPVVLSEVFEHEHEIEIVLDKEYYGKQVKALSKPVAMAKSKEVQ